MITKKGFFFHFSTPKKNNFERSPGQYRPDPTYYILHSNLL